MRIFICALLFSVGLATPIWAADFSVSQTLRQADLVTDVVVMNAAGTAQVVVSANGIATKHKVRLKLGKVAHPENYYGDAQPISDLYRLNLHSANPVQLQKPFTVSLSYPQSYQTADKVIKYYDPSPDRWKKLKQQSDDGVTFMMSGKLKRKSMIIAVFEKPSESDIVQGIASWYDGSGSACNSFPMGSRIRTTNVSTGAYVDSTIVSTGPFIPGRIVDLTREDFSAIADLSAGVVEVTVQAIE